MSSLSLLISVAVIHMLAMASPGPNVLVVTQTAMSRPRRDALAVAVGVACGALVLATGAAVGLGFVIEQVSWVRGTIQVAGGAYLVYLGILTWRGAGKPTPVLDPGDDGGDAGRFFRRGVLTNLTNPKAAVFFGSILAPVLDQASSGWIVAAAVAIVVVNALWWHCLLAVLFSRARVRRWYGGAKLVIDRVVGAGLALLGIRLALEPV